MSKLAYEVGVKYALSIPLGKAPPWIAHLLGRAVIGGMLGAAGGATVGAIQSEGDLSERFIAAIEGAKQGVIPGAAMTAFADVLSTGARAYPYYKGYVGSMNPWAGKRGIQLPSIAPAAIASVEGGLYAYRRPEEQS